MGWQGILTARGLVRGGWRTNLIVRGLGEGVWVEWILKMVLTREIQASEANRGRVDLEGWGGPFGDFR
jgi:hypothetical protein